MYIRTELYQPADIAQVNHIIDSDMRELDDLQGFFQGDSEDCFYTMIGKAGSWY